MLASERGGRGRQTRLRRIPDCTHSGFARDRQSAPVRRGLPRERQSPSPAMARAKSRAAKGSRSSIPSPTTDEVYGEGRTSRRWRRGLPPRAVPSSLVMTRPVTPGRTAKGFNLGDGILAGGGVEHQQHVVRRRGVDLAEDANDLLKLGHQLGLVLQAAGRIDHQDISALGFRPGQRVEGEAGRVRRRRRERRSVCSCATPRLSADRWPRRERYLRRPT